LRLQDRVGRTRFSAAAVPAGDDAHQKTGPHAAPA
jgi:hypothetical protein